jgi:hypothetical protein
MCATSRSFATAVTDHAALHVKVRFIDRPRRVWRSREFVCSMSTVLLIALLALAFLALLKIADTFRDLSFEIRQTRFAIEQQTKKLEEFHNAWWAWGQREPAEKMEESRRRTAPTLDELMEDLG